MFSNYNSLGGYMRRNNRYIAAFVVLFCLCIPFKAFAQEPDTLWMRIYGGAGFDNGEWIEPTHDQGYVIAGYTSSFGVGMADVYVIKTDSIGDTLWTGLYGDSLQDYGDFVQQTADHGYIIAGRTRGFGAGIFDLLLVRIDSVGNTRWIKAYGGPATDWGYAVQETPDSGFVAAGRTASFGNGAFDMYLIRTDSIGDTLWTRTYGGSADDYCYSLCHTAGGGYVLVGFTLSFGQQGDVYCVRINENGDTLWTRTYGGSAADDGVSVQQTTDSGFIIAGHTHSFGIGTPSYCNVYLIKTDSLGDTLWTRVYGILSDDYVYSVRQTIDQGYIITSSYGGGPQIARLTKTDSLGNELWSKEISESGSNILRSAHQLQEGTYIAAGLTSSYGAEDADVWLVKLSQESDIKESGSISAIENIRVYPNPAHSVLNIHYQNHNRQSIRLSLYNTCGRHVKVPVSTYQGGHTIQISLDIASLPSGVYFVKLTEGEHSSFQKFVIAR
jgi:hypothetical protein